MKNKKVKTMRISKRIKELAKDIHKKEHLFVGDKIDKDHKVEDYYYLLGSIVLTKIIDEVEKSNIELFNKLIDLEQKFYQLTETMKDVSKQQKYLWQTLEEGAKD